MDMYGRRVSLVTKNEQSLQNRDIKAVGVYGNFYYGSGKSCFIGSLMFVKLCSFSTRTENFQIHRHHRPSSLYCGGSAGLCELLVLRVARLSLYP